MLGVKPDNIRKWAARYPDELPRRGTSRHRTLYDVDEAVRLAARLRGRPACDGGTAAAYSDDL